jgi:DNA-directed RNA polymerase
VRDGCVRWCQNTEYLEAADTKPYRKLIGISLRSLAGAIRAEQDILKTSKKTLPAWGLPLLFLGHEQMALITIGTLFNMIARSEFETCLPPRITPVAHEIGQLCRIERLADVAKHRAVDVAELLLPRNRNRNAAKRAAEWAALVDDENDWANNFRAHHLGEKLISLARRYAVFDGKPIFEAKEDREGSGKGLKKMQRIGLTEAAETWIGEQTPDALDLFNPIYLPMIVEPRPWTSLSEGGYLATPMKFFKRQTGKRAQQRLGKADLSAVYAAVNALQNTPYRINQAIYRFQQDAWARGLPFFGLTSREARARADRKRDSAQPEEQGEASSRDSAQPEEQGEASSRDSAQPEEQGEASSREARARQGEASSNAQLKGLEKMMVFRFGQSLRLSAEERFYFPWQVDHRGRAYPVPPLMNPQSDHIGRAVIEFADGKPLGNNRGVYWLAIHLANCYWKKKKVSFKKRRAWVQENEKEILDFASNPLLEASPCQACASRRVHRFWTEADQPWLFLAACLEWKRYKEEGPGMISHLPISMDGSCNGYQHLSAMGLDPIGGRATNLMGFEDPEDIYQWVSDLVCRRMKTDAAGNAPNSEIARQLLSIMDRELAKNATMTTPYGVTLRTIYKALCEKDAIKALKDSEKCAMYLAKLLVECIPEVAVEAGRIMEWLREVAGIIAKANRGMMWITPTGFVVLHENGKPKEVRLATADRMILVYHHDDKQKIDVRKQVDGIVAHLVHSMDAAHMMRTINRLYAEGIRHFAMVHDSYGVHACDVDLLNRVLREEFVRIYSEPVLQNFLDQQRKAHPGISLPDPPQTGDLDIQQVLSSPYFFA